jgi:DNA-3-methyladenine glycosylase I
MSSKVKCEWCLNSFEAYEKYHDEEWGVPVHDDRKHFEFLLLEGAQAGLSWATILKRRSGYKKAFANFDPIKVSKYSQDKIQLLLQDVGIIRNKLKVNGAVTNAQKFLEVQAEFGTFDQYIWSFVDGKPIINKRKSMAEIPATSAESDALSKDLKKRGFKFVGSTIMYAHMQACGLVNDHIISCFRYEEVINYL